MTVANIEIDSIIVSTLKAPTLATTTSPLLKHILYIYYAVQFKKAQVERQALINFDSKVNAIT